MFTIEDLKNHRCAVKNDGTLEELQEVVRLAFPHDMTGLCDREYYSSLNERIVDKWYSMNSTDLPTQSVKDFLKPELKRGDLVWVSDEDPNERTMKLIFLTKIEGARFPFIVVADYDEKRFREGEVCVTIHYKYATKVEEPKEVVMTIQEIEKALNIQNLKIVK